MQVAYCVSCQWNVLDGKVVISRARIEGWFSGEWLTGWTLGEMKLEDRGAGDVLRLLRVILNEQDLISSYT